MPAKPWTEPLKTVADTMPCQRDKILRGMTGTEDCLHVSIYTKQLRPADDGSLQPVLVNLFGGGFMYGSNSKDFFDPEFLLRQDVVLVTVNYRVGVFGK